MTLIHTWFEQRVAQTPEATAIVCDTQSISYQKLNDCANHLALQLLQAGAKPEMCIALCLPRSIEQIIAIFAVLKSGGAYVPLDSNQSSERLGWILQESEASILVTSVTKQHLFKQFQGTVLHLDSIEKNATLSSTHSAELEKARNQTTSNNLAYVMYTSGSTGTPKGVMIEHHSVIDYCQWFKMYTDFTANQLFDYSSNYIFDYAVTNSIVPLMLGATLVICSDEVKKDPDSYLHYLETEKINLINTTPSFFKELVQSDTHHHRKLPHLRSILLGGENLPTADCHAWLNRFKEHVIFNEYGPTETTIAVTHHKVTLENSDPIHPFVPIGKPGPTMQTFIFNENLESVNPGDIGELYIGGSCLARGYLNQPELTEKSFIQYSQGLNQSIRLYKTGDLCRQNSAGDIEYIGRIDKQIKIRGYRVELNEIEIRLRQHDTIQDAAALVRTNHNNEPLLIAYYILKPYATSLSYEHLHHYLMTFLPDFMIPNAFVQVECFPRTANDKLDERALPMPAMTSTQQYKAPQSSTEQLLAKIWAEELHHDTVGINDNFFELGGHSLSAARILTKVAQQLGRKTHLQSIYQAPTIEQFAMLVEQAPPAEKLRTLMPTHALTLPLEDIQFISWLSQLFESSDKKLNVIGRRRIEGSVHKALLDLALQLVIQKHDVFSYHIHRIYPFQTRCIQPSIQSKQWIETTLSHLPDEEIESYLTQEYYDLFYKKTWRVKSLWIQANLYHLKDTQVELQVCMSHLIADEESISIFFRELSQFYLLLTQSSHSNTQKTLQPYQHYVIHQHNTMQANAHTDQIFWINYLQNCELLSLPKQYMEKNNAIITTHIPLPKLFMANLNKLCSNLRVGLNDIISAAVCRSLLRYYNNNELHKLCLGIIKSTRDDPLYDEVIGCFLRMDVIKLDFNHRTSLQSLAKQAQQSTQDTAKYQRASTLVKVGAIGKLQSSGNKLIKFFIGSALKIIRLCFPTWQITPSLVDACKNIVAWNKTNQLLININILSSFLNNKTFESHPNLLGLTNKSIPLYSPPPLLDDYIFDIFFHCSNDQNLPFMVITAPLTSDFQQRFGETLVSIINDGENLEETNS